MKDICEITGLSRGGLYSHFASTKEIFEAILEVVHQKDEMNFYEEMEQGMSAIEILDKALYLMEEEMNCPEDSLSKAIFEYAGTVGVSEIEQFTKTGIQKWSALIEYGIQRKEFQAVDVNELVHIIWYAYQGVRMWSCVMPMTQDSFQAIVGHIRGQLIRKG